MSATAPWRHLHRPNEGKTPEWLTPPHVFDALGIRFDLDPCSPAGGVPWIPAVRYFTEADDGLARPWEGRVWMNPPYGRTTGSWMRKLAEHGDGIGLVFARTDVAWWHETVPSADAVCFLNGRLWFLPGEGQPAPGNAGAPSALVAYGRDCAEAVRRSGLGIVYGEPL